MKSLDRAPFSFRGDQGRHHWAVELAEGTLIEELDYGCYDDHHKVPAGFILDKEYCVPEDEE